MAAPTLEEATRLGLGYPKIFRSAVGPTGTPLLVEFPILIDPPRGRCWRSGDSPGPVRAIYNRFTRDIAHVVYHDPTREVPPYCREHPFSEARYEEASSWRTVSRRTRARI